jgi:hypothetical protein
MVQRPPHHVARGRYPEPVLEGRGALLHEHPASVRGRKSGSQGGRDQRRRPAPVREVEHGATARQLARIKRKRVATQSHRSGVDDEAHAARQRFDGFNHGVRHTHERRPAGGQPFSACPRACHDQDLGSWPTARRLADGGRRAAATEHDHALLTQGFSTRQERFHRSHEPEHVGVLAFEFAIGIHPKNVHRTGTLRRRGAYAGRRDVLPCAARSRCPLHRRDGARRARTRGRPVARRALRSAAECPARPAPPAGTAARANARPGVRAAPAAPDGALAHEPALRAQRPAIQHLLTAPATRRTWRGRRSRSPPNGSATGSKLSPWSRSASAGAIDPARPAPSTARSAWCGPIVSTRSAPASISRESVRERCGPRSSPCSIATSSAPSEAGEPSHALVPALPTLTSGSPRDSAMARARWPPPSASGRCSRCRRRGCASTNPTDRRRDRGLTRGAPRRNRARPNHAQALAGAVHHRTRVSVGSCRRHRAASRRRWQCAARSPAPRAQRTSPRARPGGSPRCS